MNTPGMKQPEYLLLGVIGKTAGVKGKLRLNISHPIHAKKKPDYLFIDIDGGLIPFYIEEMEIQGDGATISLEDIRSVSEAEKISGADAYLPASLFRDKKENFFPEITGYTLIDKKTGTVGRINAIITFPMQEMIQLISAEKKEILVPVSAAIIIDINHSEKTVLASLPEGITEV